MKKDVLERIVKFGKKKKEYFDKTGKNHLCLFEEKTFKDLDDHRLCTCSHTAIDYDQAIKRLNILTKSDHGKSADALKIPDNQEKIDFIEIKGSKLYVDEECSEFTTEEEIKNKVNDYALEKKALDSYASLHFIATKLNGAPGSDPKIKNIFEEIEKNFYVLTEIDIESSPLDYLVEQIAFLGSSITPNVSYKLKIYSNILSSFNDEVDTLSEQNEIKVKFKSCKLINFKQLEAMY